MTLQHDNKDIRLREWRDFRAKYELARKYVEDWNEGEEQSRLIQLLLPQWSKRVTKEESKRAKNTHTVKMMLHKDYRRRVVNWVTKQVARDIKWQSLRKALLITAQGDRERARV